jgi:hypothetical protein
MYCKRCLLKLVGCDRHYLKVVDAATASTMVFSFSDAEMVLWLREEFRSLNGAWFC